MIEALLIALFIALIVVIVFFWLWLKETSDSILKLYDETIILHKNNTELWDCIYRLQRRIAKLELYGGKDD